MCMKERDEGCILKVQQDELKKEVANVKERLTKVETDVNEMRAEYVQQRDKAILPSTKEL